MTQPMTIPVPASATTSTHSVGARRPIPRRVVGMLVLYFVVAGAIFAGLGVPRFHSQRHWLNDYHFYYNAAKLVGEGHADILYKPEVRVGPDLPEAVHLAVFPFPATLAVVMEPLTELSFGDGKALWLALSIVALAVIPVIAYRWSRDPLFGLLVALSGASLFTTYEALRFSQLAPVLALALCLAMITLGSSRWLAGGLLLGLLALKPSVLAAPMLLGLARRRLSWLLASATLAVAIVLVVPLFVVGVDGLKDYAHQLARFRDESFRLDGRFTAGAGWMMNWNGFIGKLFAADPSPYAVVPLDVLTGLIAVRAWLRTDLYGGFLAATLVTLLVVPHAVWYDWLMLVGVAPFALYVNRSPAMLALLVGLHLSVSVDSYVIVTTSANDRFFFSTTLLAAATLAFLAFSRSSAAASAKRAVRPSPAGGRTLVLSETNRVLESTDAAPAEAGPTAGGRTIGR